MTPLDPQAQFHRFVSDELVSDIGSDVGLSDDEFEALMAPFEPFEQAPRLGLGLSGGADSTALLHLALDWARRRGGTVVPLIIDHGLRSESTLEACAVADKSRALGLDPVVLKWKDDPPGTGVEAAARTGAIVNLKKGQFLSPAEMGQVVNKAAAAGGKRLLVTDRGTTFGYNNLVADMRAMPVMRGFGFPVVFDATHSVQMPGGGGDKSSGNGEYAPVLARAAVAAGANGVFIETHPDPAKAWSDGLNMVPLKKMPKVLNQLVKVHKAVQ